MLPICATARPAIAIVRTIVEWRIAKIAFDIKANLLGAEDKGKEMD
jgi:hypothetical protein